jgi:protein SCO1/2
MFNSKKRNLITVVILCAVMAFMAGLFVSQHFNTPINIADFQGTLLKPARDIKPFALTGIDGVPFDNAHLHGQWTFVFFGFTHCGSVCPVVMAELGKMYRTLQAQGVRPLPQVVMVTLDPEQDDAVTLSNYVHAFDFHFYAARGDEHAIRDLTRELGIAYAKTQSTTVSDSIEHTGAVILFNPQGQLSAFFTTPKQAVLVHDFVLLLKTRQ